MSEPIRILGVDPGSRVTGFGIIDAEPQRARCVVFGCVKTRGQDFAARLKEIHKAIRSLVSEHRPAEMAIERVFVHRNPDSALKLGQARAAALCATFDANITIHEYAAREIKLAIVGSGNATKEQVQHMVSALLVLDEKPESDAADALAAAICHAHMHFSRDAWNVAAAFGGRIR
ncbi:MAG: crossover junction endodeoxyribonuclease RuvC [Gammaproteobacteria bacterium]